MPRRATGTGIVAGFEENQVITEPPVPARALGACCHLHVSAGPAGNEEFVVQMGSW